MDANSTQEWQFCKHCGDVVESLDDVPKHRCFIGKAHIYSDDQGNLYAGNSDDESSLPEEEEECKPGCSQTTGSSARSKNAFWNKDATRALISLYEAKKSLLDHPKKKTKIWHEISQGLKDAGIKMTHEQVRWKFNRLHAKYKECVDNNKRSGRAHMTFDFYKEMDEVFNVDRCVGEAETLCSKMAPSSKTSNVNITISQTTGKQKENLSPEVQKSIPSTSTKQQKNDPCTTISRSRPLHGTGSNTAKTKLQFEKYCLEHFKSTEERQKNRDEKIEKYVKVRSEAVQLKKRELDIREKDLEYRKTAVNKKLKLKEQRHEEIMEIEKLKCNLLRKLLHDTKDKDTVDSD